MLIKPGDDTCTGSIGPNIYKDKFDRPWYTAIKRVPPYPALQPALNLDIPSYGVIFLTPPEDAKSDAIARGLDEPEYDHVLTGTCEITLPEGLETVRYESIRIGVRCVATLNMGLDRGVEEDEMFKTEQVFEDGNVGKVIEGSLNVSIQLWFHRVIILHWSTASKELGAFVVLMAIGDVDWLFVHPSVLVANRRHTQRLEYPLYTLRHH